MNDEFQSLECHQEARNIYESCSVYDVDYYDGVTAGFLTCKRCKGHYAFKMLDWDDNQKTRVYALAVIESLVIAASMSKLDHTATVEGDGFTEVMEAINAAMPIHEVIVWNVGTGAVLSRLHAASLVSLKPEHFIYYFSAKESYDWFEFLGLQRSVIS